MEKAGFLGLVFKEKIIGLLKWLSTRPLYLDLLQLIIWLGINLVFK
jgi:hypothetical protein